MNKVTSSINWDGVVELPNGLKMYSGTGNFVTTATTSVFYHPLDVIYGVSVSIVSGSFDAQDQPCLQTGTTGNTVVHNSDGSITPVTARTATVLRDSSGSSGAGYSIILIGR